MSFQALRQAELHLEEVSKERFLYKMAIDSAKQSIWQYFSSEGVFNPPEPASKATPCSRHIKAHYSFDMAQQVFYPQQPGPMYFLTPRKCAIFGVCCEALPCQVNYLIDEAVDTGKGANAIISMLHHFFEVHGLREQASMLTTVGEQFHGRIPAVACAHRASQEHHHCPWSLGTLSSRLIGVLAFWRKKYRSTTITYTHTCACRYRRTKIGGLPELMDVVNSSATVNVAQAVGDMDGTVIVPSYDWTTFLAKHINRCVGIKSFHHLRFTGMMSVRTSPVLKPVSQTSTSPHHHHLIHALHLLRCHLHLFCCHAPTTTSASSSISGELSEPRAKRPRLCGICKGGHNAKK